MLKPFGVVPRQMKVRGINKNGYERAKFDNLFDRYLEREGSQASTALHPLPDKGLPEIDSSTGPSTAFRASTVGVSVEPEVDPRIPRNAVEANGGRGFRDPRPFPAAETKL
jgi:hypothetical protein